MSSTSETVKAILNKEDKAVEHVLNQNKHLFEQIGVLRNELELAKKANEELEIDNDSLCKSKTVMQGFLKNIHELNLIENKLKKINQTMFRDIFLSYYVTICVNLVYNLLVLQIENRLRQNMAYITLSAIIFVKGYCLLKYRIWQSKHISNLEDELVKAQRATDLVNELFDNL